MDTSGRAILLAGTTVVIALLGMFATGVAFMYGLAIAAVIAVLLRSLPRSRCCPRSSRATAHGSSARKGAGRGPFGRHREPAPAGNGAASGRWRGPLGVAQVERNRAGASVAAGGRLARGDGRAAGARVRPAAGRKRRRQRPGDVSSRHAFDLLAQGFGPGIQRPAADRGRAARATIDAARCPRCAPPWPAPPASPR